MDLTSFNTWNSYVAILGRERMLNTSRVHATGRSQHIEGSAQTANRANNPIFGVWKGVLKVG